MGFFTDISRALCGGDSKQSSVSDTAQRQTQEQTSTQNETSTALQNQLTKNTLSQLSDSTSTQVNTGTQATTGATLAKTGQQATGKTSNLDAQSLGVLRDQILKLNGATDANVNAADVAGIRDASGKLVANASTDVSQLIKAAQDTAKLNFSQNEAPAIAGIQQQIGSKGNTFSRLLEQNGNATLATRLAQISADITAQNRGQSDQELLGAIDAFTKASQTGNANTAAPLQNLLAAIQAASGAETVSTSEQAGTQDIASTGGATNTSSSTGGQKTVSTGSSDTSTTTESMQQVAQLLQQLAMAESQGHSTSSGEAAANNGWLNNIVGLFK